MKAEVQDLGNHEKSVRIEIPQDKVDHELGHTIADLRKGARIKGFRAGKAPESVIISIYKDHIDAHAREHLIRESLPDVLEENEIVPVSEPVIDADPVTKGKPWVYTARFEVQPEVTADKYKGLEVVKKIQKVDEETVEARIKQMREENAQFRGLGDDHEAEIGDTLFCSFAGTLGDQEVNSSEDEDARIELGSEGNIEGFDERLKGIKAGEERQIDYDLPEETKNPDLAGKHVNLHVKVNSVRRKEVPELDDEFVLDLGMDDVETVDALKEHVRQQFADRIEEEANSHLRDEAGRVLAEANEFDVPPSMIDRQTRHMLQQWQQQFQMQGIPFQIDGPQADEMRKSMEGDAKTAIQRHLLLESVAKQEGIEVSDEDVEAEIRKVADGAGQPYDKVRAIYEQQGMLDGLKGQLRQERALDFVLEHAKVSEQELTDDQGEETEQTPEE